MWSLRCDIETDQSKFFIKKEHYNL
jgi:hypothetical protein